MSDFTVVPSNGEVLVWMYLDNDSEGEENPFFLNQCPIIAWRVFIVDEHDWATPILTDEANVPSSDATLIRAILKPNGKVYSMDGMEQFDTVKDFAERWRKFYTVKRDQRISSSEAT